ncbi:hypothetical protein BDY24DRAFT_405047 [Mrakia frigida]|uniref:syntaxin n=1 Tax=Mrakia frigida TaxID=29902 RepID=UPI003FCC06BE
MAPPPTAPKLLSLLSSTLPLILERTRSVSLSLTPSAFTEATIVKNLALVTEGILVLEAQEGGLDGTRGEMVEKVRSGRERLLVMMEEDEEGKEKVRMVRERLGPPKLPSPPPPPPASSSTSPPSSSSSSSLPLPRLSRTAQPSDSRINMPTSRSSSSQPYRDEPTSNLPSPSDQPYRDDGEVMLQQRELMDDQDTRLSALSHSIGRQHHLSLQIGDELEVHQGLLDDTDMALDRTGGNLGRARRRLDGFAESAKNNGSVVAIIVLIVLLAILILVFKT